MPWRPSTERWRPRSLGGGPSRTVPSLVGPLDEPVDTQGGLGGSLHVALVERFRQGGFVFLADRFRIGHTNLAEVLRLETERSPSHLDRVRLHECFRDFGQQQTTEYPHVPDV